MLEFFVPLTVICVTWIIGWTVQSSIKAYQNNNEASLSSKDKEMFLQFMQSHQEMNKRIENLESIITSIDKELLSLKPSEDAQENTEKVEQLSQKLKS